MYNERLSPVETVFDYRRKVKLFKSIYLLFYWVDRLVLEYAVKYSNYLKFDLRKMVMKLFEKLFDTIIKI